MGFCKVCMDADGGWVRRMVDGVQTGVTTLNITPVS